MSDYAKTRGPASITIFVDMYMTAISPIFQILTGLLSPIFQTLVGIVGAAFMHQRTNSCLCTIVLTKTSLEGAFGFGENPSFSTQ
jgi:hypothetical protein